MGVSVVDSEDIWRGSWGFGSMQRARKRMKACMFFLTLSIAALGFCAAYTFCAGGVFLVSAGGVTQITTGGICLFVALAVALLFLIGTVVFAVMFKSIAKKEGFWFFEGKGAVGTTRVRSSVVEVRRRMKVSAREILKLVAFDGCSCFLMTVLGISLVGTATALGAMCGTVGMGAFWGAAWKVITSSIASEIFFGAAVIACSVLLFEVVRRSLWDDKKVLVLSSDEAGMDVEEMLGVSSLEVVRVHIEEVVADGVSCSRATGLPVRDGRGQVRKVS